MTDKPQLSLAGRTLRFKFNEGQTAGTVYEHEFNSDGTVTWRDVSAPAKGKTNAAKSADAKKEPPAQYASFEVAPGVHLVSYKSGAGYTLTTLVNTNDRKLHGFVSGDEIWMPLTGELQPSS